MGSQGRSPRTGRQPFVSLRRAVTLYGWLQASLLGLGGSPSKIAPARMQGVYATRLCRTQSQPSVHSPAPRGRGLGLGIENKLHFSKIDFFYKLTAGCATRRFCLYHTLFYPLTMCHFHHLFKMLLRSLAQIQYVENQQQILNLTPCWGVIFCAKYTKLKNCI